MTEIHSGGRVVGTGFFHRESPGHPKGVVRKEFPDGRRRLVFVDADGRATHTGWFNPGFPDRKAEIEIPSGKFVIMRTQYRWSAFGRPNPPLSDGLIASSRDPEELLNFLVKNLEIDPEDIIMEQ
ncbi:MAG: hypothetical protein IJI97_05815 [Clostridia bacterium]|nr:hypothetical protein [Clostridia bacterium]